MSAKTVEAQIVEVQSPQQQTNDAIEKLKALNAFKNMIEENTKLESIGRAGNKSREKTFGKLVISYLLGRSPTKEEIALCL